MGRILFVGLAFGVTLLAGCAGQTALTPPEAAVPSSAARAGGPRVSWQFAGSLARPDARPSWIAAAAKKHSIIYISDEATNNVYLFTYPQGKLVGTLTGFSGPGGLCTDRHGDVFVPNVFTSTIVEYAHGGTTPIATLNDGTDRYPNSCAIDPVTGDLAVANNGSGTGEGPGDIAIYRGAAGSASFEKAMYHPYSCGYDPYGNLFVDGEDASFDNFRFGELTASKKRYHKIDLNQPIALAGGVAWDGASVAVGDVYGAVIYQFSISGSNGNRIGSTQLTGTVAAWQFDVDLQRVVVPNSNTQDQPASQILNYDYPNGGAARKVYGTGIVRDPVGATISLPK
ncbi:MAG TPA: hypothetical protein VHX17_09420 [Candidatus Cybelea sp.]|jgi:hypothetical protein|nr:hypothetical protein [Candidatus Cybelea sp.]